MESDNFNNEIWKDIKGYEGLYQISNLGRVKNVHPRYKNKIYLKNIIDRFGYCKVWLYKNKKGKGHKIHRLVAEHFIEKINGKDIVNHIDGNKQNNFVSNLEWVTTSENNLHAARTGLSAGHKHNKSKLSFEDVMFIRNNYIPYSSQYGINALSKKFNVGRNAIFNAVHGITYKLDKGNIRENYNIPDKLKKFIIDSYIPYDKKFGITALSKRFGLSAPTVNKIVGKMEIRIKPDDIMFIIENYIPRDKKFGGKALAKKFNVCERTIWKIINKKINICK